MSFSEISGNANVVAALTGMIDSGRIPHALMFHEDDGGGAFPLCLAFLQYLFCRDKKNSDSCGLCPSCNKISKLIHPDVHFIFPTAAGSLSVRYIAEFRSLMERTPFFTETQLNEAIGIEGKNSIIAVSEAKNLLDTLSLSALEGGYRAVVLYLPEKMNQEASNRLLKIIEEPPAGTLFLLITHRPEMVLQTVSSRCQQFRVKPADRQPLSSFGSPELFDALMSSLISRDLFAALEVADSLSSLPSRESAKSFCDYAAERMRRLFLHQQGMTALVSHDENVSRWAASVRKSFPRLAVEALSKARILIDRNVNFKLVFADMVNKMYFAI